jgi:hypothetical protein
MAGETASVADAGYKIEHIDINARPDVAALYGVSSVPCFVLLRGGRELSRKSGVLPRGSLLEMFHRVKVVTQRAAYDIPDRLMVDYGTMRPIPVAGDVPAAGPLVPVQETQCGPEGCQIPGQQQRRPGLGVNRDGFELNGILPWNRQKQEKPPVIVNVAPPVTGTGVQTQEEIDAINARIAAMDAQMAATKPPVEPETGYSGILVVLSILIGGVVAFAWHYAVIEK